MPLVHKIFDTNKCEFAFTKQSQGWRAESWEGPKTEPEPGLDYNHSMAGCNHVIFSFFAIFFCHISKFLFGSEQINKTLKVHFKRADQECGTICCVQHYSTKFHKEKETMWTTFRNCTSEQISQHFSGGEKKIHSSAWGPPLCMTKPKNEIKNSTPSENRGSPERINAHPEK